MQSAGDAEDRIRELTQTNAALERMNRDLRQFAYTAAHDLQEPVRTMTNYASLLQQRYQDKLDAEGNEFLSVIQDGAQRMKLLIQELLAYANVGSDAGQPRRTVELQLLAQAAIESHRETISQTQGIVACDKLPALSVDPSQLTRVFLSLLDNALKYRHPGRPPRIQIRARKRTEGDWLFEVKDNGLGIRSEYQRQVFQPFKRLHGSEIPGAGLGLALCSRIIEYHDGHMGVDSAPGEGSSFWFTLPQQRESKDSRK